MQSMTPERILKVLVHVRRGCRDPPLFWLCKLATIIRFGERFRDGQYSLVCFLFDVLLHTVPPCPVICKSGGTCPPCHLESAPLYAMNNKCYRKWAIHYWTRSQNIHTNRKLISKFILTKNINIHTKCRQTDREQDIQGRAGGAENDGHENDGPNCRA